MEQELLYLQENGYETIWFEDLSHVEDFEKPVILTFDDGYDDNYTELFPLLQKYNAKATIFVIPKAIGTPHKMTAEQVQELSRSGLVSIQSHTYSHGNLSTMDEQTLIFEMEQSQNYLAALTGQVPYAVCYPEGTRSELSIEVARRYYAYGLLMNGQLYNTSDDPMRVKRFYVPRGYDLGSFRWSGAGRRHKPKLVKQNRCALLAGTCERGGLGAPFASIKQNFASRNLRLAKFRLQ